MTFAPESGGGSEDRDMSKQARILMLGIAMSLAAGLAAADSSVSIRIGGSWGGYLPYHHSYRSYESHSYYGPGHGYVVERYVPAPYVRSYSYYGHSRPYPRHHDYYDHRSHRRYSNRYDRYCR